MFIFHFEHFWITCARAWWMLIRRLNLLWIKKGLTLFLFSLFIEMVEIKIRREEEIVEEELHLLTPTKSKHHLLDILHTKKTHITMAFLRIHRMPLNAKRIRSSLHYLLPGSSYCKQGNPVSPTEPASTAILFYFYYLKLIQLYWCLYKVFSAPLKLLLLSKFLLHCCFYEVSTASLKLLLFQQCSFCIAVHTTKWLSVWWV